MTPQHLHPAPPTRLLVVDDDDAVRHIAAQTLRQSGFEVVEAVTGDQALALFAAQHFDLVLLDVQMPGRDGFETCRQLRRLPGGDTVPVLILTGLNDRESIDRAFEAGATDFFTKHMPWALLGHRVRVGLRIAERLDAERRLRHLALHDQLTGLPNRDFFLTLAESALAQARRSGAVCALLQIDVDRFKSVNDAWGDAAGDEVLRCVAQRLRDRTRGADAPAPGRSALRTEVLARVGGNVFSLLLVDVGRPENAALAAERLRQVLAEPMDVQGRSLQLTASAGVALCPRDASDAPGLLRFAEQALYEAKKTGYSGFRFFDEAMNAEASAHLAREADLRRAIAEGGLQLHLQPKQDARDGRIVGAEALVRWDHPERGAVPPADFIALAEETGLILPLTDWVLEQVCAQMAAWAVAGVPPLPVSVNMASPCLLADDLLPRLQALLQRHGLHAGQLMLEVTESLLMEDLPRAEARLHALRAQGFLLSLDDFGTGYSSLGYIQRFPIDEIKIDRSFVHDVHRSAKDGALVGAIVTLARLLNVQVVAEGVQTAEQAAALQALGCHVHQGYLYSASLPAADFAATVQSHR